MGRNGLFMKHETDVRGRANRRPINMAIVSTAPCQHESCVQTPKPTHASLKCSDMQRYIGFDSIFVRENCRCKLEKSWIVGELWRVSLQDWNKWRTGHIEKSDSAVAVLGRHRYSSTELSWPTRPSFYRLPICLKSSIFITTIDCWLEQGFILISD